MPLGLQPEAYAIVERGQFGSIRNIHADAYVLRRDNTTGRECFVVEIEFDDEWRNIKCIACRIFPANGDGPFSARFIAPDHQANALPWKWVGAAIRALEVRKNPLASNTNILKPEMWCRHPKQSQ